MALSGQSNNASGLTAKRSYRLFIAGLIALAVISFIGCGTSQDDKEIVEDSLVWYPGRTFSYKLKFNDLQVKQHAVASAIGLSRPPEWIDFPREGNGWSYKYARRQWSLVDNPNYFFADLNRFDEAMIQLLKKHILIQNPTAEEKKYNVGKHLPWVMKWWDNEGDQVVAYSRNDLLFIFNWNGQKSFTDYGMLVPEGKYKVVLNTDAKEFAGFGLSDDSVEHFTEHDNLYAKDGKGWLKMYIPARSAIVLQKID